MNSIKKFHELKRITLKRIIHEQSSYNASFDALLGNVSERNVSNGDEQTKLTALLSVASTSALFISQLQNFFKDLEHLEQKYNLSDPETMAKILGNDVEFITEMESLTNSNHLGRIILDDEAASIAKEIVSKGGSYTKSYHVDCENCEKMLQEGLISQETRDGFSLTYSSYMNTEK